MDWLTSLLFSLKSILPSLHGILHYLDSILHRNHSNRELEFVYSNTTDINRISDADAYDLLKNLVKKN